MKSMRGPWVWMILLVLILGSSSCDPCRRLARIQERCPFIPDTVLQVQVDTMVRWNDTTILVPIELPGDTITDSVVVYVHRGEISSERASIESGLATASAEISEGVLSLDLIMKDTLFWVEATLEGYQSEIRILRDRIRTITQNRTIEKKKIPGIGWLGIGIFISLVLFIVLRILGKI